MSPVRAPTWAGSWVGKEGGLGWWHRGEVVRSETCSAGYSWLRCAALHKPTLSSDRRPVVPVQSFCIPGVPPPTPISTPGRHQPETALGQIPRAPRSTRPGGSRSPQGPRGRISLRFDRYFPIRSGFPPPWTLLPRQPDSRDSPWGRGSWAPPEGLPLSHAEPLGF